MILPLTSYASSNDFRTIILPPCDTANDRGQKQLRQSIVYMSPPQLPLAARHLQQLRIIHPTASFATTRWTDGGVGMMAPHHYSRKCVP